MLEIYNIRILYILICLQISNYSTVMVFLKQAISREITCPKQ